MAVLGSLLIDEYPLIVQPSLANALGLNEAIFLQQLHYWLKSSRHVHDGMSWVYNTMEDWQKQFSFWCTKTISRCINSLEKRGYIISTQKYNSKAFDKTKWYTINYVKVNELTEKIVEEQRQEVREIIAESLQSVSSDSESVSVPTIGTNCPDEKKPLGQTVPMDRTNCLDDEDKLSISIGTTCPIRQDSLSEPIPETTTETNQRTPTTTLPPVDNFVDNFATKSESSDVVVSLACSDLDLGGGELSHLAHLGLSTPFLQRLAARYGSEQVREKMRLLRKSLDRSADIANPAGWLIKALEDNYVDSAAEYAKFREQEREEARRENERLTAYMRELALKEAQASCDVNRPLSPEFEALRQRHRNFCAANGDCA